MLVCCKNDPGTLSVDAVTLDDRCGPEAFREAMLTKFSEMQIQLLQMRSFFLQEFDRSSALRHTEADIDEAAAVEATNWLMADNLSKRHNGRTANIEQSSPRQDDSGRLEFGEYPEALEQKKNISTTIQRPEATMSELESQEASASPGTAMAMSPTRPSRVDEKSTSTRPSRMEEAPMRAFVINVRRLVEVEETLALLHEFVKSTAIAALTLVNAATSFQFVCTMLFLVAVFVSYSIHESDWDTLDVSDLKMLLPLLCDDLDQRFTTTNPNRIFKACSVAPSMTEKWIKRFMKLGFFSGCVLGWVSLGSLWSSRLDITDELPTQLDPFLFNSYIHSDSDAETLAMQLTVATLMFLLDSSFRYILWREMNAVLPHTENGEIWDPRRHGTPFRYRLFGLPSMWFTSKDVARTLEEYVDMAHPGEKNNGFLPQELAYYALSGDDERYELQKTFRDAKLFDDSSQAYVLGPDDIPQELKVDLVFFDSQRQHASYPYLGEFQYFTMDDEEGASLYGGSHIATHMLTAPTLQHNQNSSGPETI